MRGSAAEQQAEVSAAKSGVHKPAGTMAERRASNSTAASHRHGPEGPALTADTTESAAHDARNASRAGRSSKGRAKQQHHAGEQQHLQHHAGPKQPVALSTMANKAGTQRDILLDFPTDRGPPAQQQQQHLSSPQPLAGQPAAGMQDPNQQLAGLMPGAPQPPMDPLAQQRLMQLMGGWGAHPGMAAPQAGLMFCNPAASVPVSAAMQMQMQMMQVPQMALQMQMQQQHQQQPAAAQAQAPMQMQVDALAAHRRTSKPGGGQSEPNLGGFRKDYLQAAGAGCCMHGHQPNTTRVMSRVMPPGCSHTCWPAWGCCVCLISGLSNGLA